METIESKVVDAILQREKSIVIRGKQFEVEAPTPATLMLVSELSATLPQLLGNGEDTEQIFHETLSKAKDCKALGKIAATLILGAKRIRQNKKVRTGLFGWKSELDWLSDVLLEEVTMKELTDIVTARLIDMRIADFFGLTTSLSATNILKPTKEVVTQSGV